MTNYLHFRLAHGKLFVDTPQRRSVTTCSTGRRKTFRRLAYGRQFVSSLNPRAEIIDEELMTGCHAILDDFNLVVRAAETSEHGKRSRS